MATDGYLGKDRVDHHWWLEQLKYAAEFRRKVAFEEKWPAWRSFYRGQFDKRIMPVNLFYMMLRSVVPRTYFRNPSVSVTPDKPGLDNAIFAKLLERADNKLIRQIGLKKQMRRCIAHTFAFGTGFVKVGFGGIYSSAPNPRDDFMDKHGNLTEYYENTRLNMPWALSVHPSDVLVEANLSSYEYARWVAHKITRTIEDVKGDERFDGGARKALKPMLIEDTVKRTVEKSQASRLIDLYEIRDRKTGKVFVIACQEQRNGKVLLPPTDDPLQIGGMLPVRPLVFNDDDQYFWGLADSQILEPYQLEINEARTQIQRHRRASMVKVLARQGAIEENEAKKFVDDVVSSVVNVKGSGPPRDAITLMQSSTIPPELFESIERTMQDVRETVGFSRNQFGEFNSRTADTTATEAQIVKMAAEIRIDERRDIMADFMVELVELIHQTLFLFWGPEEVVEVVGPGGVPVWLTFRTDLLRQGRYNVKIDPDSALPETRAMREQKAVQLYEILKMNPMIDPYKLTQFLLHELHGTEFDDMIAMMPAAPGVVPGQMMNPQQFAGAVQGSAQRLNSGTPPNKPKRNGSAPSAGGRGKPSDGAASANG